MTARPITLTGPTRLTESLNNRFYQSETELKTTKKVGSPGLLLDVYKRQVKWTVKGDTSAVEGYEIWRSTKKNSGFSKFFTTTKTTYKNTKSLKKGTRYYYKVRAIAHVDGKKITSDWSNKAYRIAK